MKKCMKCGKTNCVNLKNNFRRPIITKTSSGIYSTVGKQEIDRLRIEKLRREALKKALRKENPMSECQKTYEKYLEHMLAVLTSTLVKKTMANGVFEYETPDIDFLCRVENPIQMGITQTEDEVRKELRSGIAFRYASKMRAGVSPDVSDEPELYQKIKTYLYQNTIPTCTECSCTIHDLMLQGCKCGYLKKV